MVIDFHVHWDKRISKKQTEEYFAVMDEFGIDKAVLLPIHADAQQPADDVNLPVIETVKHYPERFIGFCSIMPHNADAPEILERYSAMQFTVDITQVAFQMAVAIASAKSIGVF